MVYKLFVLLTLSNVILVHAENTDPSMSADGMDGMDMGGLSSGGMMTPWLHFALGDSVWFSSWVPQSAGALVGASIGLFLLAIVERWIASIRGLMEVYWKERAEAILAARFAPANDNCCDDEKQATTDESIRGLKRVPAPLSVTRVSNLRALAPFVPTHDIVRGVIYAVQSTLNYGFMLAVMTFQGAYLIAIVLGLGVGEALFGRFASLGPHAH